jgi:fucose 4-O-acetylase-like acetyltransferase
MSMGGGAPVTATLPVTVVSHNNTELPKEARSAGVDALRLLALFAIVTAHAYPDIGEGARLLRSLSLPIFFTLTGFFWSRNRPLGLEVEKRLCSLILPYVLWLSIITAIVVLILGWDANTVVSQSLLGGSYATRPFTTFWFFTALFVAAVGMRLLDRIALRWLTWVMIVGGLLANICFGPALAKVPLSIATALGALAFIQFGRITRTAQMRYPRPVVQMISIGTVIASIALVGLWPHHFPPLDMKVGQFPLASTLFAIVNCGALVMLVTSLTIPYRFGRMLTALAASNVVVIIVHPLLLLILSGRMPYSLVTLLAFLIPLLLGQAIIRSPLAMPLTGVSRVPSPGS